MKRTIKLTESDLTRIVKRILKEQSQRDVEDNTSSYSDKPIPVTSNLLNHLRGKHSVFFRFGNMPKNWITLGDTPERSSATTTMLDFVKPTETYNSFDKWKKSKWYNITKFPFSDGRNSYTEQESIFNSYLHTYGNLMIIDLTT
jgi:hypothetical protein